MDGLARWLPANFGSSAKTKRATRPRTRRRRPFHAEPLEERILLSATSAAAAAQSALGKLPDPAVRQAALADYAAHQSITRSDLLSIFTEIEQDHVVTAAEFSSLSAMVSQAGTIGMPGYVAQLLGKVVNGDPANVYLASSASANGDLFPGAAAAVLKSLVSDWFQGMGPIGMTNSTVKLTWVGGQLFSKAGPEDIDIKQGVIGDCTLLASLAEVALRQPTTIENMFINNGDGTYTVRLYRNGSPNYVTVAPQLPNGGQLYDSITDGVLWAALAEKAVVEENASGWLATWQRGSDSYAALNGGDQGTAAAYLATITGLPSSYYGINPSNIAADWNAGKLVLLSTGDEPAGSGLVTDHCYAMAGYNAASSKPITLFNPWGIAAGEPSVALSTLTSSFQFEAAVGSAPGSNAHVTTMAHPLPLTAPGAAADSAPLPIDTRTTAARSAGPLDLSTPSTRAIDAFFAGWSDPFEFGRAAA